MTQHFANLKKYLKLYFEVDSKTLRKMAFDSAKEYYSTRRHTRLEFQEYQRGYIGAYRGAYAKAKLAA